MIKQSVDNIIPKITTLTGIYRGVVENNVDPQKMGRCQIRVWGLHDELKEASRIEGIPTASLPWSEPCLGLLEGSVTGAGLFSVPLQGSHVFLFFEGGNWNAPRYFATAPGLPTEAPDTSKGFNDPEGKYPRSDRLNEPDFHRLARGEITGTIVEHKNENLDLGVTKADTSTWDEPESAYAATYPNNIVLSTHRGILIELDNTAGKERIHLYHPSNTYIEIDVEGNVVFKNEGNKFEITKGDRNKHIFADDNETIDIDKTKKIGSNETVDVGLNRTTTIGTNESLDIGSNETVVVGIDATKNVGNNLVVTVGTNSTKTVGANEQIDITGNLTETIGGNSTKTVGANEQIDITGNLTETVGSGWTIIVSGQAIINATGDVEVVAGGSASVTSTGPATVQGSIGVLKGTSNTFTVS
jgi:hypothetical protein